jgi:hypothetical protein
MSEVENKKIIRVLAILSLILSFIVYLDTMAPTVSFWDCGEFIATSYILGVPHPPGSPMYILLGRFFSMLPIGNDIAYRVNLMSPIASAFAVMFLFLIIVKLLKSWGSPKLNLHKIAVYGGAFIGAMTFAFTDSHWFNAVESEVYAMATLLTALVVWLILVWEEKSDQPGHERYLLLIAYIIGIGIGVHLLNLVAIFFIALIIYFKRTSVSSTFWLVIDIIIGVAVIGLLFLFFHQLDISFAVQAVLTLGTFAAIYLPLWKRSNNPRYKEHAKNVLMAFAASCIFLIINGGVISGMPTIADKFGVFAVAIVIIALFAVTIWAIVKKHNLISLSLMCLVLIVVGYSSYVTIFIRSSQDPAIDENDPETTRQAVAYLQREQYGRREFTDIFNRRVWKQEADYKWKDKSTLNYFWNYQIKHMYIRYFNWQFIGREGANVNPFQFILPFPFLIGVYGLLAHFNKDKKKALAVLALFLFTGLMIVLYLNQDDPQPRERDYSYAGSFFAFSIWIGIGTTAIISHITQIKKENLRKPLTYIVAILLLLILPINVLANNYQEHDRTGNYVAWDYSYNILQTCDKNGIVFTNGDNDTFPLWYLQEVGLNDGLIPDTSKCIRKDVRVVNLSLLNTPWYIKQLKHNEPKVAIGLSDRQIEQFGVIPWEKRKVQISPPPGSDLPPLEWELEPTIMGRGLRVQDLMILQIIEANKWKKPIYFAVTVSPDNKIGLDPYLQMEGLAFKLHPQKVEKRINPEKLKENYFNVYKYRNLNDPDVYFNDNIIKLIVNYRSGFLQLAIEQLYSGDAESMLATLDTMASIIPEEIIPINNKDLYLQIGFLYYEGGRAEELERRLAELVSTPRVTTRNLVRYASVYIQYLNDYESGASILENLYGQNPNNPEIVGLLVRAYEGLEDYGSAIKILDDWLKINPGDSGAASMQKEYMKKLIEIEQSDTTANEDTLS